MYSVFSTQGRRPYQEDKTSIGEFKNFGNTVQYFAVFDGHGGGKCSLWLSKNLLPLFEKHFLKKKLTRSNISRFIVGIDVSLRNFSIGSSGSTAIILLLCFDKTILVNLGDSRALCFYKDTNLYPRILQATKDHSVANDAERIAKTSAFIMSNGKYLVDPDSYMQLGVARAFGDFEFKRTNPPYVSNVPDVYKLPISYESYYVVLASDGLWDVFSNENAIRFIDNLPVPPFTPNSSNTAEILVKTALKSGSQDNITAIFLKISA